MKFHLKVEGVNFASCLFDTNDISVIRGSSLLLDTIAEPVADALAKTRCKDVQREWAGASTSKFTFEADDEKAAQQALVAVKAQLLGEPYRHLSFVASIGHSDQQAEARNRAAQFRQWTVPDCAVPDSVMPDSGKPGSVKPGRAVRAATKPDALDGMRPAAPGMNDTIKGALSPSVKARLDYGRANRRGFFEVRAPKQLLHETEFCDSFHDMVKGAPDWVSETVRNKLAVIHFDGDGFGKARAKAKSTADFSDELNTWMQDVLAHLVEGAICDGVLRLEVLVWGGDDITLVVPAWRALPCVRDFYAATQDMTLAGQSVGFTGGVIIGNYKAPIRQLTALAGDAVDRGKEADARRGFTIDAFESAAPPENGLDDHRNRVFGKNDAKALSIPGQETGALIELLTRWKSGEARNLPSRSRLYDLLSRPVPVGDSRDEWIANELERDARRRGAPAQGALPTEALPAFEGVSRGKSLEFKLAATMWDYVPTAEQEADA